MTNGLSDTERTTALQHLQTSLERFEQIVRSVPELLWTRRPSDAEWSPAELAEHLVLAETRLLRRLTNDLIDAPESPLSEERTRRDATLPQTVALRDPARRVQAPEFLQPTGRFASREAALEAFREVRSKTIEFVRNTVLPLRSRVLPHMALGELDGYQWLLLGGGHTDRHLTQMQEHVAKMNIGDGSKAMD
jgi:DinB family protein